MKKRFGVITFLLLAIPVITLARAEDATQLAQATLSGLPTAVSVPDPAGINAKVSLDLRNIEVIDALKFLSQKSGLNIISTKNVAGRVTLMVENVPVKDIFDIMLRSNGLAYSKEGEIYNVMTEDEYKALFGKKFADVREVKVFRLKYAIPEQVFSMLDAIKSEIGRVLVASESGTVMVMDTADNLKEIEKAINMIEQKNSVNVYNLKYAKAKDVEEQLKNQLDAKKVGTVKADERSNQIIVQTLPDRMDDVEKFILALDKKTKQVLIDTKIVKIKLTNDMSSGFEWEGLFDMGKQFGLMYLGSAPFSVLQPSTAGWKSRLDFYNAAGATGAGTTGTGASADIGAYPFSGNSASVNSSTKVTMGEKFHVGIVDSRRDIDTVFKYLQTLGKTQILSNPKLAVINNQEARIHVGEKQAYITSTTTTGSSGTSTVSEEVTFVDVGIQLAVTPTINDDGYVTMKVKPEVSSVVDTLETSQGNKIPIIDSSMAETTVMVKDGATIIIGGLRREEKTANAEQMPFMAKIPLLGFLFKSSSNTNERTELLVMMTPYIVSGDMLTTGDDRYFEGKTEKDKKEYPKLSDESDLEMPQGKVEENIKSYRQYKGLHEKEKEAGPEIKAKQ